MSMIDRSLDGMASLSGQIGAMLRRRLREVSGIALLSLAMMAALALATWSVQDPSLSHATDAPVRNLLGHPGAITADLLMQLLGLGSLALLLPIAIWGYRLLGHRPLSRERLRMLLWLFGAVSGGGVCVLPAAQRALAVAVRARRRHRRRGACGCRWCCSACPCSAPIASPPPSCSASPRWSPSPARPASSGATRRTTKRTMRKRPPKPTTKAAGSRSAG